MPGIVSAAIARGWRWTTPSGGSPKAPHPAEALAVTELRPVALLCRESMVGIPQPDLLSRAVVAPQGRTPVTGLPAVEENMDK